jgi:hypothetical protein
VYIGCGFVHYTRASQSVARTNWINLRHSLPTSVAYRFPLGAWWQHYYQSTRILLL